MAKIDRLQLLYPFENTVDTGRVFISITNNSNQWFLSLRIGGDVGEDFANKPSGIGLRFNGRLIGVQKWHRAKPEDALKLLVNLAQKDNAFFVRSYKKSRCAYQRYNYQIDNSI